VPVGWIRGDCSSAICVPGLLFLIMFEIGRGQWHAPSGVRGEGRRPIPALAHIAGLLLVSYPGLGLVIKTGPIN